MGNAGRISERSLALQGMPVHVNGTYLQTLARPIYVGTNLWMHSLYCLGSDEGHYQASFSHIWTIFCRLSSYKLLTSFDKFDVALSSVLSH